jgi:hypothetical protein
MADLPILFSPAMVRALIAGRKTQTRRILPNSDKVVDFRRTETGAWEFTFHGKPTGPVVRPPRIAVGDRLYVREHWRVSQRWNATAPRDLVPRTMTVFFNAGGSIANQDAPGDWKPSDWPEAGLWPAWAGKHRQAMHMPRWASRITLIVEGVKIERLQDISEEDAIAEGIDFCPIEEDGLGGWKCYAAEPKGQDEWSSPYHSYRTLWDSINGAGAWRANPWVVAYTFRLVMGNIDRIGGGDGE